MEKRCDLCKELINEDEKFVYEQHREGEYIDHEATYHQECFVNSMVNDLEKLGFKVLRPRGELKNKSPVLPDIKPTDLVDGLKAMDGLLGLLPKTQPHDENKSNGEPKEKPKSTGNKKSKK